MPTLMAFIKHHAPFVAYAYKGTSEPCNLCGDSAARLVCDTDRRLKRLRTVTCETCGLVRTDPMPSEAELVEYYSSGYRLDYQFALSSQPPRFHLRRSAREALRRFTLLSPLLRPNSRVLDLGAGSGEFLAIAAAAHHLTQGLEPGREFAAFARRRHGLSIECRGWQAADFPPGSFDLITANHVLEHLRAPVTALRRLSDWLADDGVIHVAVPNVLRRRPSFQAFHFAHVHNFTPDTLLWAGLVAGLEPDPRVAVTGTTIVFRKSRTNPAAAPWGTGQGAKVAAHFPPSSIAAYVMSGRWGVEAARRLQKVVRDSWTRAG